MFNSQIRNTLFISLNWTEMFTLYQCKRDNVNSAAITPKLYNCSLSIEWRSLICEQFLLPLSFPSVSVWLFCFISIHPPIYLPLIPSVCVTLNVLCKVEPGSLWPNTSGFEVSTSVLFHSLPGSCFLCPVTSGRAHQVTPQMALWHSDVQSGVVLYRAAYLVSHYTLY